MDITFQFNSIAELINMAGHGPYVWVCYLVTFIGLAYLLVGPMMAKKRLLKTLARQKKLTTGQAIDPTADSTASAHNS